MKIGLRIDVDTFRGTKYGVPDLCKLLADHSIKASFFFSVGPDNMGRNLWRLFRPAFFTKMIRSKAASLYGWDILLRGTFCPGPVIGKKLGDVIQSAANSGHETGIHAWDHHKWQTHIDTMDASAIHNSLNNGVRMFTKIFGQSPTCSASPGWRCNNLVLREKNKFSFDYNSDCRGTNIFRPIVDGKELPQLQVPVTLPTYDEVIGHNGISDNNYNDYMLSLLNPDKLNVLTIHAEVEGIACFEMFNDFIKQAESKRATFVPLATLVKDCKSIDSSSIVAREISGREGWVCCQDVIRIS